MINPSPNNSSDMQISCYAKQQSTDKANFVAEIDYRGIEHGALASRSKAKASAIVWPRSNHANTKKNRIFFSIEKQSIHKQFNRYMNNLLQDRKSVDNIENGKLKYSKFPTKYRKLFFIYFIN